MTRQRALIAGMTDYTGVSLDDIIAHLTNWQRTTNEAIELLRGHLSQVEANRNRLDEPCDIEQYIQFFIDLFSRYSGEFARLVVEIPNGVEQRHVEIVDQIFSSSKSEEAACVSFKRNHINRSIKDESLRYCLLDQIYKDTKGIIVDYLDLSNLSQRLKTFVGSCKSDDTVTINDVDAVELKPNIFGIGINLNHIIKRIIALFKGCKKDRKPNK